MTRCAGIPTSSRDYASTPELHRLPRNQRTLFPLARSFENRGVTSKKPERGISTSGFLAKWVRLGQAQRGKSQRLYRFEATTQVQM